jgi:hypothetical protein
MPAVHRGDYLRKLIRVSHEEAGMVQVIQGFDYQSQFSRFK